MPPSRIEQIEAMLADRPRDIMLRYMLGMELIREGDESRYLPVFRDLMAENYVPAFFRLAQQFVALERIEEARTVLREGIELARQQDDPKTASEMSELLASIGSL